MCNPTESSKMELKEILKEENDWINEAELGFPQNWKNTGMASLHECNDNPPRRPVISGDCSLTEPLSEYIDFFLTLFLLSLFAYIQHTTDVQNMICVPENIEMNSASFYGYWIFVQSNRT